MIGRVATTASVLALSALAFAGCGSGDDSVRVQTTSPAAFVDAVTRLVQPLQRMGVVATVTLEGSGAQPARIEVDGLVDDMARELHRFSAIHMGDPALAAEQKRLLAAVGPIAQTMRQVRAAINAQGHRGLKAATTVLLNQLKGLPSIALSPSS